MTLDIREGVVEECRVLALNAVGDVIYQTPTRHTRVGLPKARKMLNWQTGWLRRAYSQLNTLADVTYKLQWLVNGRWLDHEGLSRSNETRQPNRAQHAEPEVRKPQRDQEEVSLGPKFTQLRKAAREETGHSDPPPVPKWIRRFPKRKIEGWTNKFHLMQRDPNIYSESLRVEWKKQFDD
jgi:hypothetical protein